MDKLERELDTLEYYRHNDGVITSFGKAVGAIPTICPKKSVRQKLALEQKRKLNKQQKRLLSRLRREAAA